MNTSTTHFIHFLLLVSAWNGMEWIELSIQEPFVPRESLKKEITCTEDKVMSV